MNVNEVDDASLEEGMIFIINLMRIRLTTFLSLDNLNLYLLLINYLQSVSSAMNL